MKKISSSQEVSVPKTPEDWWSFQEQLYRETVDKQLRRAEKRAETRAQRREDRARAFGDLCEASEGRAVVWRRERIDPKRLVAFANEIGDVWLKQTLVRWIRLTATREIDRMRHNERRPLYYAHERERRIALAQHRRKVTRRTTVNACPTKEAILSAWLKVHNSDADLIRFGSLMEDLECYVDNSLQRNESGEIIGRNGGIKQWLFDNIPALYLRYSSVMRCKAAARKLRQITELADPIPAAWIVAELPNSINQEEAIAYLETRAETTQAANATNRKDTKQRNTANAITVRTRKFSKTRLKELAIKSVRFRSKSYCYGQNKVSIV